jgi:exosortase/archaeosortase
MSTLFVACLGWSATAVFVGSYFFVRPSLLRGAQMFGASLWIIYGLLINASPVIVANILVFIAAAWTTLRKTGAGSDLAA